MKRSVHDDLGVLKALKKKSRGRKVSVRSFYSFLASRIRLT